MSRPVLISFIVLVLLALGAAGTGVYYYMQYQDLQNRVNNPNLEVEEILAKAGKLIDLPVDEQPTVATVNNPEAIRDQPFFAKAKKGDRVILYSNAGIAVLFDDKDNKILNFGTINVGDAETPPAEGQTEEGQPQQFPEESGDFMPAP